MSVVRFLVEMIASILVGGSVGYAASRAFGVRAGRVEVALVLLAVAAYLVTGFRGRRPVDARMGA